MLKMIDLKPYGAFVEHTIRPLLKEFKFILTECKKQHINLTEHNVQWLGKYLADLYVTSLLFDFIKVAFTTGVVCLVAYWVLA